jgi:hypothetical protein
LGEKVSETNDGTRAHLRRAGSGHRLVEPVMRVHIESKVKYVCMYIFLCKIDKKVNMVSGFSILSILLELMNLLKHVDKNIYGFRN